MAARHAELIKRQTRPVRKRPPFLKRLVLARGRVDEEIERREIAVAKAALSLAELRNKIVALQVRRNKFDDRIREYNDRFRPELIPGIHAWRSYPGKRGALRKSIIEILQSRAPEAVNTNEICFLLQAKFSLQFQDADEYANFRHNTVGNALKWLVRKDWVRRLHDPKTVARSGVPGVWSWIKSA